MSLDINLTNVQSTPIVVNANITAENNKVYHVIANATFTDPTPVEGMGYFVVVRNASSCALGGNSYIAGETIHRIFHSGSWLNIALRPSTYVPISRTINGLDLSANRTLTTGNINDSTDKRYVTDAQKTDFTNPKITVECIDALTVDFYAMYTFQIDSVTAITNSPTTTILVNNSAYTFGVSIATGAKITVTLNTAGVVNLNTTRL